MADRALRAVSPDDPPPTSPKAKISTVLSATEDGSRLDELIQVRRVIARALDNSATTPTAIASLSLRLIDVSKEIEAERRQLKEDGSDAGRTSEDEAWNDQAV